MKRWGRGRFLGCVERVLKNSRLLGNVGAGNPRTRVGRND